MIHGTTLTDAEVTMLRTLLHGVAYGRDLTVVARSAEFASFAHKVARMHAKMSAADALANDAAIKGRERL